MICLDFDWQIDEFMVYCRSSQLRPKTMQSYEQTLRLFERWCLEQLDIRTVDKVTESVIRHYIRDLQERGKYTFYAVESQKETNHPDRRRDFRKPIATTSINNYIRNLRVFFNWLDRNYLIKRNPMKKVRQLRVNRKAKEYLSDDELRRLLTRMDRSYYDITYNNCRACGFEPRVQFICDDPYFVRKYVSENMGIALSPAVSWSERFRANTVIVPIDNPPIHTTTYLLWDENRYMSPAVRKFMQFVIEQAKSLEGNLLNQSVNG